MKAKNKKLLGIGLLAVAAFLLVRKKKTGGKSAGERYRVTKDITAGFVPGKLIRQLNVVVKKGEILNGPLIQESFPVMCITTPCPPQTFWGISVTRPNGKVFVNKLFLQKA